MWCWRCGRVQLSHTRCSRICWRRWWVLKRITSCGTSVARIWPPSRRGSRRCACCSCARMLPRAPVHARGLRPWGDRLAEGWDWRSSAVVTGWHTAAGHSADTWTARPRYAAPPACEHTAGSAARPRAAIVTQRQSRGIRWRSRSQGSTARLPASRVTTSRAAARPAGQRASAPGHPDTPVPATDAHQGAPAQPGSCACPTAATGRDHQPPILFPSACFSSKSLKLSHTPPREEQ